MRFALLAADADSLRLARAAALTARHQLVAAYESESSADPLLTGLVTESHDQGDWVRLLHDPDCEAVIVGRSGAGEHRSDQLRKLVQAGMPLVVVHPICDMLTGFELQMIQRDTATPVVPYFPGLSHPLLSRLAELCRENGRAPLGSVQQLVLERQVKDGSQQEVFDQFARDALLCRRLLGRIDRLGALGSSPYPVTDWANLSVHMTSHAGVVLRWSARLGAEAPAGQLSLIGSDGRIVCELAGEPSEWTLQDENTTVEMQSHAEKAATEAEPLWALDALSNHRGEPKRVDELWEDACRSVELTETIETSYRRGKTIELYHEEHTEEDTFKSMMAAGGCLALLGTLMIFPLLAVIESLDIPWMEDPMWQRWPWRVLYWGNWPLYLLIALAIFLGLQVLRLVFRGPHDADDGRSK